MCGVCGKVNLKYQPIQDSLLRRMCRSFEYRGPDDEGIYIFQPDGDRNKPQPCVGFGHQRLSIIDLSHAGRWGLAKAKAT